MALALSKAISLEGDQARDSPCKNLMQREAVSVARLTMSMMKTFPRTWSKEGIKENQTIDHSWATTRSLHILDHSHSRLLPTWDPAAWCRWIKGTWLIAMHRTRISQSGSIWANHLWMNDSIEEWASMSRLAQEEDIVAVDLEDLQTQSQIAFRARWTNPILDLETYSVGHSPLALAVRATLELIIHQNQPKARSRP